MTPLPAPNTLGDIYSMNPAAFAQAQDIIGQGMQGSQIANAQGQEALDQSYRMNPLLTEHQGLQNATARETLPGITAESAMRTRKNRIEGIMEPEEIQKLHGNYSSAELKRHADDFANFGQLLTQHGANIAYNPFGGVSAAKQAFKDAGHGDMWQPEWDDAPASMLSDKFTAMGNGIMDATPNIYKALSTANIKATSAENVQTKKSESADLATAARLQAAQALVAQKRVAAATPKSMSDWIAKMDQLAQAETDPEVKRQMTAHMLDMVRQLAYVNSAAAATNVSVKPSLPGVGVDEVGVAAQPGMPSVAGAQGAASAPRPAAAPKAAGMGMHFASPEGKAWVQRAMEANKGMTEEQVVEQGLKSGRLK